MSDKNKPGMGFEVNIRNVSSKQSVANTDGDTPFCIAVLGEAEYMMYSFDVKFEGKNVCRLGDPLWHNKKNIVG